ncbi:MAG: hypothetical protein HC847_08155 [Hydrococcus sp. RU_2_2]|jgi:hypothetical protein|nr:hypothetical protein [Hydrococcus sp. RU_2_2]NJP20053.1 hypothetical protein [Hydrococcus sp. CRU_1_1]
MNVKSNSRIPWLSLVIFWLAYALLGWYLSAHDIIWLVGALVALASLSVAWKSNPLLKQLLALSSQGLVVVVIASVIVSILITLAITWNTAFNLIVIPCVATALAQVESRFAGWSKPQAFLLLTFVAGFGLIFGEIIDLTILSHNAR